MVSSADLKDPLEVRKGQKRLLFMIAAAFVCILVFGLWFSDPNKGKPTPREQAQLEAQRIERSFSSRNAVTAEESWIASSETELQEMRRLNREMSNQMRALQQQLEALRDEQRQDRDTGRQAGRREGTDRPEAGGTSPALPPPPQAQVAPPPPPLPPPVPEARPGRAGPPTTVNQDGSGPASRIQVVSLSRPERDAPAARNIASYLPAGSFATVVLLSGVDAPTGGQAQSSPVPVLLRLVDVAKVPNFWESEIKDCHVTGAAYGEISSERVHVRTETLTCVLRNGDIVEERVQGYVAGEDGKAGLRGRLVEKQGQLLAKSFVAGLASGGGNAVAQQFQQTSTSALGTVTSIDPNRVLQAGAAEGFSNAMERLADYYIDRANEMYPVIEVDARRIGELILLSGTDMGRNIQGETRRGPQ